MKNLLICLILVLVSACGKDEPKAAGPGTIYGWFHNEDLVLFLVNAEAPLSSGTPVWVGSTACYGDVEILSGPFEGKMRFTGFTYPFSDDVDAATKQLDCDTLNRDFGYSVVEGGLQFVWYAGYGTEEISKLDSLERRENPPWKRM